jgi:hypothetical protein
MGRLDHEECHLSGSQLVRQLHLFATENADQRLGRSIDRQV